MPEKILPFCDTGTFATEQTFNRMAKMAEAVLFYKECCCSYSQLLHHCPSKTKGIGRLDDGTRSAGRDGHKHVARVPGYDEDRH